jgi:carboxymethylenebutenolidase
VPDHVIPDLRAALAKTDVKHTIKIFPGTHHGFAFPERAVYETIASEQTWADMFAMWDRCLK